MTMNEFEMIQTYFLPLTMGRKEAVGLADDAAILDVPEGFDLVVSSDTLNEGTHFVPGEDAAHIAHKALRVNLSDMAAMGARPYCYQMNLAFPDVPEEAWVQRFSTALLKDNEAFDVFCSGGDTTVTKGVRVISLTITGFVPKGKAVLRSGVRVGDLVVLTGPIGQAYLGVKHLLGDLELANPAPFLRACHMPEPRIGISDLVCKYARAAVDISDGLIADLGHVCRASKVGARLNLAAISFTEETAALIDAEVVFYEALLSGGEDYELVMAVARDDFEAFRVEAAARDVSLYIVGVFEDGDGVQVIDEEGGVMALEHAGWTHF